MLYLIPTPIGNLDDITVRSLKLFKSLSVFCAEDTRTFKGLMTRYEISHTDKVCIPLTSYTSPGQLAKIIEMAKLDHVWVVSEAGTPWLSDPAKELIKLCREHDCPFEVLPWANALIPAVVASPCDTTHFTYHGFLPTKKWRKKLLEDITQSDYPVFLYESVHRVDKLLQEIKDLNFDGTIWIFRELTKMYEQKLIGTAADLLAMWGKELVAKGEFVIGIYPAKDKEKGKRNKYPKEEKWE